MSAPSVHLKTLPAQQQAVLRACGGTSARWGAYLAGGTALALRLGHRQSDDFDWFTAETLDPTKLLADIEALGFPVTVSQNDVGTFLGVVGGVKFSVFRYRYGMVAPLVSLEKPFAGCRLAAFRDLAAMKLAAVMARATKRDYVDLHALLTLARMSLAEMLEAFSAKFPDADPRPALRAITYFVDVEKQRMPIMQTGPTWEEVKAGLLAATEGSRTTPKAKSVRKPKPKPRRRR